MSNELWRTTLSTLRSQFESCAQQYPGVHCVLIHAGSGQCERLKERPREAPEGKLVDGGFSVYADADTPEQCTWRREYYIGEPAGVYSFWRLANDAGRALLGQSPPASQRFPRETLTARTDRTRWLWTLFELGWQPRTGSPLMARKLIWDRKHTGRTTFPYDAEALRSRGNVFRDLPFMRAWAERLPDYYCSELSDVFMASVYAIDILLHESDVPRPTEPAWQRLRICKQPSGDDIVKLDGEEYRVRGSCGEFLELLQAKGGRPFLRTP